MIGFNSSSKYKNITMLHLIHRSESESLPNNVLYWQKPPQPGLHWGPSQDPSLQSSGSFERPVLDGDINLLTWAATSFRFPFHNSFCDRLPFCAAGRLRRTLCVLIKPSSQARVTLRNSKFWTPCYDHIKQGPDAIIRRFLSHGNSRSGLD